MTRYKTSLPMIDSDTGGINFDGLTSDGTAGGNLSVSSVTINSASKYVSGATLSLNSGAVQAGAAGATLSLASGATLNAAGQIAFGAPGTTSVSVATASGTTVPISQAIVRVSNTAASTSGSCTLAAGVVDGQCVTIINEGGANFVVTGNMKANQTLSASSAMDLVWISTDTAWWRVN